MSRIILGGYMVRYPLGGMMSWVLQYLVGLQRLGHEVYFVEKSGYPDSCYDPEKDVMSDDCSYGMETVNHLLARYNLDDRWCYVDAGQCYHGMTRSAIETVFNSADLFLDIGTFGDWAHEASGASLRVMIDGEPGFTQIKAEMGLLPDEALSSYDFHYTYGLNIGTAQSTAPTAGSEWRGTLPPVVTELFPVSPPPEGSPMTTVMNWQSHRAIEFNGVRYGQKDVEFARFMRLPSLVDSAMEVALSGGNAPLDELRENGWLIRNAHAVTRSVDSFVEYIQGSSGEFSVCKNVFAAMRTGWFSDRSAAYLASGRPVVVEDTGMSQHLPCGTGLFAVTTVEEAAQAINEIVADYNRHSRSARVIAVEYLDSRKVLGRLLADVGL